MRWEPAHPSDLAKIPVDCDQRKIVEAAGNLEAHSQLFFDRARTGWLQGCPVVSMGVIPHPTPGVWEAWIVLSDLASSFSVARAARRWIEDAMVLPEVRRLQATCAADDKTSSRWLRFLGFDPEGVLRSAGFFGEDLLMHSRVSR